MKSRFSNFLSCTGAAALLLASISVAAAQCGLPNKPIKPMSWHSQWGALAPSLTPVSYDDDDRRPSIIGMWHVEFSAQSQNGEAIPAPYPVIDNSVVVWHPDGTEIMNSSRSAQDGNFCLGVWKQTGERTYYLNHIPWQGNVYDPTVPPDTVGAQQDGAQLLEKITLSPNGDSYTGTFTLHAYKGGSVYVWFAGTISAKRITTETPFSALL
jgi:hypothetical protein